MNDSRSTPGATAGAARIALWTAAIVTAVYLVASWLLFRDFVQGDGADSKWERALVLYNPIVSIAFSALGVLLGTRIEAVNTERERARKEEVKAIAADAASDLADADADAFATGGGEDGGGGTKKAVAVAKARGKLQSAARL